MVGALAWFVVDSGASMKLGYAWNALSNAGCMAVVLLMARGGKTRS